MTAVQPRRRREDGFTLIEMIIALTITATVLLASAVLLFGGLRAYAASRSRSSYLELGNAAMEELRALPYDVVGVASGDPDSSTAYPSGKFEGKDVVVSCVPASPPVASCPGSPVPLPAVSTVASSTVSESYTIRRWVTWTDPNGGTTHVFKALTLRMEWKEQSGASRSLTLRSILYPGGLRCARHRSDGGVRGHPRLRRGPAAGGLQCQHVVGRRPQLRLGLRRRRVGHGRHGQPYLRHRDLDQQADRHRQQRTLELATRVITVSAGASPPAASFTATPLSGTAPLNVAFDGTASTGTGLTYAWTFGDAGTASGPTPPTPTPGSGPTPPR